MTIPQYITSNKSSDLQIDFVDAFVNCIAGLNEDLCRVDETFL